MTAEQFYLILVILLTLTNWFFIFLLSKAFFRIHAINVKCLSHMKREEYWLSVMLKLTRQDAENNEGMVKNPILLKEIERLQMINMYGYEEYYKKFEV